MTEHIEIWVPGLPDKALDAAREFHATTLPGLGPPENHGRSDEALARKSLAIVFPPAGHTHRGWRLAVVQALAREWAPVRVNGVVGDANDRTQEVLAYLREAHGVTGQLLIVQAK